MNLKTSPQTSNEFGMLTKLFFKIKNNAHPSL